MADGASGAVGCIAAASAHAADYKTVYCAAANGSHDPVLGARPGFFNFPDLCGTAYGDPPGDGGFLRLEENATGATLPRARALPTTPGPSTATATTAASPLPSPATARRVVTAQAPTT